jgi:hypothetical protein
MTRPTQAPLPPEAPPEGRYLTVQEISTELALPVGRIRRTVAELADRIPWKESMEPGRRGAPRRIYHESGLSTIAREARKRQRRHDPEDAREAHWTARASLRLFEKKIQALSREAGQIYDLLKSHPPTEQVVVHTLPHPDLVLIRPITLTLVSSRGSKWQATLADLPLTAQATTKSAAVQRFRKLLPTTYLAMEQDPSADPEMWTTLQQLIERRALPAPRLSLRQPPQRPDDASTRLPTYEEWKDLNQPEGTLGLVRAWRDGATARFYGESACRYRNPAYIQAWRRGYSSLSGYLEAGGRFTCSLCEQTMRDLAERSPDIMVRQAPTADAG